MSCVRLGQRPRVLPRDTYNTLQRRGINYEKRVVRDLVLTPGYEDCTIIHGQWLYGNETFCQPDILVLVGGRVIVLEVKLSRKASVFPKMRDKYVPWVRHAFPGKIACGQIYRNLNGGKPDDFCLEYFLGLGDGMYGEVIWK